RREALHALSFGGIGCDVDYVRLRGYGVRPLNVQARFHRPGVAVLRASALAVCPRWLYLSLSISQPMLGQRGSPAAGLPWLAAHVLQAYLSVEVSQVGRHIRVPERVNDRDGDSLACVTGCIEGRQVVGVLHRGRREAASADGQAGGLGRRSRA